jgi:hypothetical protein
MAVLRRRATTGQHGVCTKWPWEDRLHDSLHDLEE